MSPALQKIVVVVGATASGKTSLAVSLARAVGGEVVSADSRQVYRGLDIGTDKVTDDEMRGVRHHLIDIREPSEAYSAADFLHDADAALTDITARGMLPIVAGGTFFYIDALLGRRSLAGVPADPALRAELEALSTDALYERLYALDAAYATRIDRNNPRRLVRAVEIATARGSIPPPASHERYDALIIGIDVPPDILAKRIEARIDTALARGLMEETRTLLANGVSESRLSEIGLEYRVVLAYLHGTYTADKMKTVLVQKVCQYAKRQRTWLRKMQDVVWIHHTELARAPALVEDFCTS